MNLSVGYEALDCLFPKTRKPTDITVSVLLSCWGIEIVQIPYSLKSENASKLCIYRYFISLSLCCFSQLLLYCFRVAKIRINFGSTKLIDKEPHQSGEEDKEDGGDLFPEGEGKGGEEDD